MTSIGLFVRKINARGIASTSIIRISGGFDFSMAEANSIPLKSYLFTVAEGGYLLSERLFACRPWLLPGKRIKKAIKAITDSIKLSASGCKYTQLRKFLVKYTNFHKFPWAVIKLSQSHDWTSVNRKFMIFLKLTKVHKILGINLLYLQKTAKEH